MHPKDLSLLACLDVLLSEGSVAGAASRMNLSTPAMSRILGRIRSLTGDPILVRAGRGMVPTPRAEEIREQVSALVESARQILQGSSQFSPHLLKRTFTLRATDGFVSSFGSHLIDSLSKCAPHVSLRFAPQGDEDVAGLREGAVDLDIASINISGPEIITQSLFSDRFVGVVKKSHPLASGKVTVERFCKYPQISASRRGRKQGPLDLALQNLGQSRTVAVVVSGFADAVFLADQAGLVAVVPELLTRSVRHGLMTFQLPVATPPVTVSLAWHPKFQFDPAHSWLRTIVKAICSSDDSSDT